MMRLSPEAKPKQQAGWAGLCFFCCFVFVVFRRAFSLVFAISAPSPFLLFRLYKVETLFSVLRDYV